MENPAEQEVRALARALYPGARMVAVEPLRPDEGGDGETTKAIGYGEPLKVRIVDARGVPHELVLHTAAANDFGHDRRADRAEEMLLAFDTFNRIPRHARAVDVGAVTADGDLISLCEAGEFYLITEYVSGRVYAEDLRLIAASGEATREDLARVEALARYLVDLHTAPGDHPAAYRRAIRDLVGHGECVFGISDGYPDGTPGAPRARLDAIERTCLEWRFRLRDRAHRLRRTHGDFHPFNIVFQDDREFRLLDASRGSQGDPADDVAALAINFPFFGIERKSGFRHGLGRLWQHFFGLYLDESGDDELLEVIAPFLAFRALVVCNPLFYPALAQADRDRLLGFVERALAAPRFDPDSVWTLFPDA